MSDKRHTVEDIGGEFGWRLVWDAEDHWADVKAYEVVYRCNGSTFFARKEWRSLPDDTVTETCDADPYLTGYVKWDGCSEFDLGSKHFCGPRDYRRHCALLKFIYHRAYELMGREPDRKWDEVGNLFG